MAIKHGSKVDKSFSASSMTDLMFLLLLFLLIATTLINPNALKLMLPKSSNQLKDKAMTTVSVQDAGHGKYRYYVELQDVGSIGGVERVNFSQETIFSDLLPLTKVFYFLHSLGFLPFLRIFKAANLMSIHIHQLWHTLTADILCL